MNVNNIILFNKINIIKTFNILYLFTQNKKLKFV